MQVSALRDFILSQGASKNVTVQEWDKIWTMNKKVSGLFLKLTSQAYFSSLLVTLELAMPSSQTIANHVIMSSHHHVLMQAP